MRLGTHCRIVPRRGFSWGLALGVSLGAGAGIAQTPPRAQTRTDEGPTPIHVSATDTATVIYNTDNRNTQRADVASVTDDGWGAASNRADLRAGWGQWELGLTLDSVWFYVSPTPSDVGLRLLALEHGGRLPQRYDERDAAFFVSKTQQAVDELSDRFVSWNYPAKYSLTYRSPELEVALGDFYAQFGRGLVLSARKQNEVAADQTIRGIRATGRLRHDGLRVNATGLYGMPNPLRIDTTSGRVLTSTAQSRGALATIADAGMPTAVSSVWDDEPRPNFAPDTLYGAELEGRSRSFALSLAGTRLERGCVSTAAGCLPLSSDLVRSASTIDTFGASAGLPDLWGYGAFYVEYAHQVLSDFRSSVVNDQQRTVSGDAWYGSLNLYEEPVALTVEAKHYRRFYPLRANVDVGHAREFSSAQFSNAPTTMPVWNDTEFEGFNTCVTGGRAKVDVRVERGVDVFAWLGRFHTWAESVAAATCDVSDENVNRVWDLAQGTQLTSDDRQTHGELSFGLRFDSTERQVTDAEGQATNVFYREVYLRHDWVFGLSGGNALQFQGWHRRRRQTLGGPEHPWWSGITTTGFQWGPRVNLALGLEYDQNPAFPDTYVNGQVRYELPPGLVSWLTGPSSVTAFAGQRQGGLRCVAGICRVFPPFEGVRAEFTGSF